MRRAAVLAMALAVLAGGGCIFTLGIGGGGSRGSPPAPNGTGLHARGGVGFGGGNRHAWVATAGEYRRIGDLNSAGMAVEAGLFVYTPPGYRWTMDEEFEREHGRTLGGGFALRGRVAAGGWGGEIDPFTIEGAIGIGFDGTYSAAGPSSLALYVSAFRTSLDDRDPMWTFGVSLAGIAPPDSVVDFP